MTAGIQISLSAQAVEPEVQAPASAPPPTRPRVSVIIVVHNHLPYLQRCLSSVVRYSLPEAEILMVDAASTDGSAAYASQAFPAVRAIRSEVNSGYGGGCNLGARHSSGRYLAFLNPDTEVEPGWLEALVTTLERAPDIGLATSQVVFLSDPDRVNTCGNDVHLTGLTLCRGLGNRRDTSTRPTDVSAVSGAAFAIRRELFDTLGGFDETFFLYMEDTDLSWRAQLAGHRCLCVPSSVVRHDYALRFGTNKVFYQERNRYLMLLKALRWPTLVVLLPALLVAEVVSWGYVLLRERTQIADKLRACWWVVKNWPTIAKSRRDTQALRRVRDRELLARCTWRLAFEQPDATIVGALAHVVFDPLFFLLHKWALALTWW